MPVYTEPSSSSSGPISTISKEKDSLTVEEKEEGTSTNKDEESIPLLFKLPPELIDNLLYLLPPNYKQITTLSLTRVFPDFPLSNLENSNANSDSSHSFISKKHLYTHLIIYTPKQLWPLWKKLKSINDLAEEQGSSTKLTNETKSFTMKSWKGDADILNNILRCINTKSKLDTIMLNIGTNFSPDHLEELFENPRFNLKRLELRFRPYVEQASYYQFLAGSYFDTAVETLYKKWPSLPTFTHFSIIQDLPPRSTVPPTAINSTSTSLAGSFADLSLAGRDNNKTSPSDSEDDSGRSTPPTSISSASDNPLDIGLSKAYTGHGPFGNPFLNERLGITKPKTFAQPIVFFDINCIMKFGISPIASNLTHLRLRVPSRDLLKVLINPPRGSKGLFPSLQYLDISTTNVRIDTNLVTLLRTYSRLEHLVLDRVNLFGFTAREKGPELCHDLGGLIVSAGLARGKERERLIAAWELEERTRFAELEAIRVRAQRIAAEQERRENHQDDDDPISPEILAEIAQRERIEEQQRAIELARSRRGHRSAAQSTFSLRAGSRRNAPSTSAAGSSASNQLIYDIPPPDKLYLVLPPLPTLKSIAIGGEASGVSSAKVPEWEEQFHQGWKEGLNKVLGWAVHIADKYERAKKKSDEWRIQELKGSSGSNTSSVSTAKNGHISKSKRRTSISSGTSGINKQHTKPPLDVRLFRFPTVFESNQKENDYLYDSIPGINDLTAGLIEIESSEAGHREYLDIYKQAIGDMQLYQDNLSENNKDNGFGNTPPCVFCTVPDCEGPARRGAEGERVDGRGGMSGQHRKGCGHLLGRKIWGWEGFEE